MNINHTARKAFAKLRFIVRARVKNDIYRPQFAAVHVQDGCTIATDGHRIHWADIQEIPDGVYDITSATVRAITLEPSAIEPWEGFRKVMTPPPLDVPSSQMFWGDVSGGAGLSLYKTYLLPNAPAVNLKYFMDLEPCSHIKVMVDGNSYYATDPELGIHAIVMGIGIRTL